MFAVRATTVIGVVGLSIGFGTYVLYRLWQHYVTPVLPSMVRGRRESGDGGVSTAEDDATTTADGKTDDVTVTSDVS